MAHSPGGRGAGRMFAMGATVAGVGLWFGALVWRWRIVEYSGLSGSASRNIDGAGPGVGVYLVGMLALTLLSAAVLLASGAAQRWLRALATALAAAVGLGLIAMAATLDRYTSDGRIADIRPGPAFLLAAAAVLALLLAVWTAPAGTPAEPERPGGGWFAGLGAAFAGLAALLAAGYLPLWRTTYPGMELVTDASEGFLVLVPAALAPGLLTTASLILTGHSQRAARRRCRRWLILTAAGFGGLLALAWLTITGDAYAREHGLLASRPGEGILLAYLGHVLLVAGGACATRQTRQVL